MGSRALNFTFVIFLSVFIFSLFFSFSELQCNYCPQGFMTAWGLLVHAQLTHNLKIFLEKASLSLRSQTQTRGSNSDQIDAATPLQNVAGVKPLSNSNINLDLTAGQNISKQLEDSDSSSVKDKEHLNIGKETIDIYSESVKDNRTIEKMGQNILVTRNTGNGKRFVTEQTGKAENFENGSWTASAVKEALTAPGPVVEQQFSKLLVSTSFQNQQMKCPEQVAVPQNTSFGPAFVVKTLPVSLPNVSDGSLAANLKPLPQITLLKSSAGPSSTAVSQIQSPATSFPSLKLPAPPNVQISPNEKVVLSSQLGSTSKTPSRNNEEPFRMDIVPGVSSEGLEADVEEEGAVENDEGSVPTPIEECCNDQGCGVTVIPGSHEHLKECCNAVVPKKRKRHMEQKHMPFAWGSSRYASRKLLYRSKACNAARAVSSQMLNKGTGGTIYIDVEPESLMADDKPAGCDAKQGTSLYVTQTLAQCDRSSAENQSQSVSDNGKKRSLILKPGAVFSIPFSYNVPTSATLPVSNQTSVSEPSAVTMSESTDVASKTESTVLATTSEIASQVATSAASQSGTKEMIRTSILARKSSKPPLPQESEDRLKSYSAKPFQCEKCTMTFNQRIHLKKHMSKHTGRY